jgi:hypothetical protein
MIARPASLERPALSEPACRAADGSELTVTDWGKMSRPGNLHLALRALLAFQTRHGRLPTPDDEADAQAVLDLATAMNDQAEEATKVGRQALDGLNGDPVSDPGRRALTSEDKRA